MAVDVSVKSAIQQAGTAGKGANHDAVKAGQPGPGSIQRCPLLQDLFAPGHQLPCPLLQQPAVPQGTHQMYILLHTKLE